MGNVGAKGKPFCSCIQIQKKIACKYLQLILETNAVSVFNAKGLKRDKGKTVL